MAFLQLQLSRVNSQVPKMNALDAKIIINQAKLSTKLCSFQQQCVSLFTFRKTPTHAPFIWLLIGSLHTLSEAKLLLLLIIGDLISCYIYLFLFSVYWRPRDQADQESLFALEPSTY